MEEKMIISYKDLILKSERILKLAKLSSSSWGWPAHLWEEDFKQESILVMLENPEASLLKIANTTAHRILSNYGWHKIKIGDQKKWADDSSTYQFSTRNYLYNSERKRQARMKLSPEKRSDIARKGALAKAKKHNEKKQKIKDLKL